MSTELMDQFVSEARELLESAASGFLALEKEPDNADAMNQLFRNVHTLKGTSGIFDVAPLTHVVHAGEDVLDKVRDGKFSLSPENIDLFLDSLDQVSVWVDGLESDGELPADAVSDSQRFSSALRSLLDDADQQQATAQVNAMVATAHAVASAALEEPDQDRPDWLINIINQVDHSVLEAWQEQCGQGSLTAIRYQPDEQCFFSGDDPLNNAMDVPGLCWQQVQALEAWPGKDEFDPYQCNLLFYMVSAADQPEIDHSLRYVDTEVESIELNAAMLGANTADMNMEPSIIASAEGISLEDNLDVPAEDDLACAVNLLRVQMEALSLPCSAEQWQGRRASVTRVLQGLCGQYDSLDQAAAQAQKEHSFHPLLNWIETVLLRWSPADAVSTSLDVASDIALQDLKKTPLVSSAKTAVGGKGGDDAGQGGRKPSFLRVEQERIDQLMDLVGELVVAKNSLPFLSDRAEKEFDVKPLAREIKGQYEVINRLSEEFQSIVMCIRMISVSTVFQRFPRLVRDLSRKLNKKIELVIEGEETEADKNVVEALSDPLIHLVRNSLDHGIEMPADRLAAGKPELGRITLRAVQQEDQVLIEVVDDGKGLEPEALKQKAYEKGLIDEERLDNINDHDALQLILMPGFSMAKEISDLSGRGVGMDVVNSMVKQVGGSITLHSKAGEGSTVRLSLPLSMAVTQVMMVSVDDQRFGISIEQIVETVKVPACDIHCIKDHEAIVLRDRLIPLRCLRQSLGMDMAVERQGEVAVLVVSTRFGLLGLIVDEFHAGLDIIQKPLEGVMAGVSLFTGTALLGDGSVLLILNLEELSACQ